MGSSKLTRVHPWHPRRIRRTVAAAQDLVVGRSINGSNGGQGIIAAATPDNCMGHRVGWGRARYIIFTPRRCVLVPDDQTIFHIRANTWCGHALDGGTVQRDGAPDARVLLKDRRATHY